MGTYVTAMGVIVVVTKMGIALGSIMIIVAALNWYNKKVIKVGNKGGKSHDIELDSERFHR